MRLTAAQRHQQSYATCRSAGHSWMRPEVRFEVHMIEERICAECTMLRIRHLAWNGRIIRVRYVQPEGYKQSGEERLSLAQWRITYYAQLSKAVKARKMQVSA